MKEKDVLPFLKDYAKSLLDFDLPKSDFPLYCQSNMAAGHMAIYTVDNRHVATVSVEGDNTSLSMPLGLAALLYAKLFVQLANGLAKSSRESQVMSNPKITAIHDGGDWYDACADHVILPDGVTIEDESKAWRHWYNTVYLERSRGGAFPEYKTLIGFILERGGRIPRDDELKVFTDD